jgi:hypothetical protein
MNFPEFPWTDFLINIAALAIVPGLVALIGGILSVRGLPNTESELKLRTKRALFVLFVAGVFVTVWQQYRVVLSEEGKPNTAVAALKKAFPWLVPPQSNAPASTNHAKDVRRSLPPATTALKPTPNLGGIPPHILTVMLKGEASRLREDWERYWNEEDRHLSAPLLILPHINPQTDEIRAKIKQVEQQRDSLKAAFDADIFNHMPRIVALQDAAIQNLHGPETQEDEDKRVILRALASGTVEYTDGLGIPDYLDGLAKRIPIPPKDN